MAPALRDLSKDGWGNMENAESQGGAMEDVENAKSTLDPNVQVNVAKDGAPLMKVDTRASLARALPNVLPRRVWR